MKMAANMIETWQKIDYPKNEGEKKARRVVGTNCWLSKSHDGSLGLIMVGVDFPNRKLELKNIFIDFWERMTLEIEDEEINLENCLTLDLDSGCDAGILVMILDRMFDLEPSGRFRTDILYRTLDQVMLLFKKEKRPPNKEEVIGAWGELIILEMAIRSSPSAVEVQRRISSWESYSGRTIIDFNFSHIGEGVAIEVKTSISGREHHIHGLSQVTPSEDLKEGWLASLQIREVDHISGIKCIDIVNRIINGFQGSIEEIEAQKNILFNRIELRGAACKDNRFGFILPNGGLRMIRMRDVPKPVLSTEITEVEWKVNLKESPFMDSIPKLISN
jgi:hypothetical protein